MVGKGHRHRGHCQGGISNNPFREKHKLDYMNFSSDVPVGVRPEASFRHFDGQLAKSSLASESKKI